MDPVIWFLRRLAACPPSDVFALAVIFALPVVVLFLGAGAP